MTKEQEEQRGTLPLLMPSPGKLHSCSRGTCIISSFVTLNQPLPVYLSPTAETNLPTSGLSHFDMTPAFGSLPSTPAHQQTYCSDPSSHSFSTITSPPLNEFIDINQFIPPHESLCARLPILATPLKWWIQLHSSLFHHVQISHILSCSTQYIV